MLKASVALALLLWQLPAPIAEPDHLRFERAIVTPSGGEALQACATLDAQVFAHAAPDLKDLRLFANQTEIPYATTLSEPLQPDTDEARILNLGLRDNRIVFDLEMPHRPYTDVTLTLARKDFLATATVSGGAAIGATGTKLGTFTLFDLTRQHLSRSTSLPLPESNFPYLHLELALSPAPGTTATPAAPAIVQSATVPPSREAQTLFTTTQQTASFVQRDRKTIATFTVPARVPVERISFDLAPGYKGNFSRTVQVEAVATGTVPPSQDGQETEMQLETQPESLTATILRVHTLVHTEGANHEIAEENLSVPVSIGSNMQRTARLQVTIDNGDDQPLPLAAIRLEMRQRRICFDPAAATAPLTLFYGDPALQSPVYDYGKLFHPVATPLAAQLSPEHANPSYHPRPETRPFTERHPELLWIVLLGVIAILAVVALRSARTFSRPPQP
jgi:hypothetical protein